MAFRDRLVDDALFAICWRPAWGISKRSWFEPHIAFANLNLRSKILD